MTCNCGTISGGTTPNTVPGTCTFAADFRHSSEQDKQTAEDAVRKATETVYIEGCSSSYKLMGHRVSMPIFERNVALLTKVNEILGAEGMQTLTASKKTGGSDASDVAAAGIPCMDNLGIRGGNSHSENEYAIKDSLKTSATQLAIIVANIQHVNRTFHEVLFFIFKRCIECSIHLNMRWYYGTYNKQHYSTRHFAKSAAIFT